MLYVFFTVNLRMNFWSCVFGSNQMVISAINKDINMQTSTLNNSSCLGQFRRLNWLKEKIRSCFFSSRSVTAQPSSDQNMISRTPIAVPDSLPAGGDEGAINTAPSEYPEIQVDNPPPIPILKRAKDIIPEESGQLVPFAFKDLVIKKINNVKCMLGEGGFGRVFMAVMSPKQGWVDDQGRKKLSRIHVVKQGGLTTWMNNEAKCLKASGEFGYSPWYKKNWVVMHDKGVSLKKLIHSRDRVTGCITSQLILPSKLRQSIGKQAVQFLKRVHDQGILHSDIKPDNIAINSRGEVSLIDFGTAVEAKREVNGEKQFKLSTGSPSYFSPEALGTETATQKMDIWAMGLVMLHMELGYTPALIEASELREVPLHARGMCILQPEYRLRLFPKMSRKNYDKMIKTINNNESTSQECKDVLLACLAYNPDDRPTAEQLLKYPYFRDKELHEMYLTELVVAHGVAFKALVEAEKAIEESTSDENGMLKNNLDRCQLRVKEIQERMAVLNDNPLTKEPEPFVIFQG